MSLTWLVVIVFLVAAIVAGSFEGAPHVLHMWIYGR